MKKYGLLDPMPLGEEDELFLKCEVCGFEFGNQNDLENYNSVEETGRCEECQDGVK